MLARQTTLTGKIRANAFLHGEREALVGDAARITYRELERRTNRLARVMLASGIVKGDRIAILLPDGIQFIELLIAAGKIGAISVLLNWRLSASEISWIIDDSAPRAVFLSERYAGLVPARPGLKYHVIDDDPRGRARYEAWISEGPDEAFDAGVAGSDPLFMMFTSGTTGRPKGCLHSHQGSVLHALGYVLRRGFAPDDRSLCVNPLFHVAGLGHLLAVMVAGGTNCFYSRDDGPTAPLEIAMREGCTLSILGRPLIEAHRLLGSKTAGRLRLRNLTWGAGMVDPHTVAWVRDQWDATIYGGYGQTESSGHASFIDFPDMLRHPASVGWPMQHTEFAILDENGRPAKDPDAVGELGIRGPGVMIGYWNNPEASEMALGTGWLRTGDMMRRDELGLFYMSGRLKELIKTGGENVYPAEVEVVLKNLPGVTDAAIAGVADSRWGEAVKAFVVLEPGATFTAEAMTKACRERIAGYKRPRYLEIVDALPRDQMGKLRRFELSARPITSDQAVT
jgi:fatty-acyl-CoA synthase